MDPIFLLFIPLIQIIIGVVVFRKNPRNALNWSFALLMISIAGWAIPNMLFDIIPAELATLNSRLNFFAASMIVSSLLTFSISLDPKKNNSLIFGPIILGLAFGLFSLTPAIEEYVIDVSGEYAGHYGWGHPIYAGYIFSFVILILFTLVDTLRRSKGVERYKIGYILLGTFLSIAVGITTNLIIPLASDVRNMRAVGPTGTIFFTILSSYAILKYRFFDIRVVIRKGLVYSILLSVLFGFAMFFVILLANAVAHSFALNVYASAAIIAAALAVLFYPLRRGARGIVDVFLARRVPTDMRSTVTNATIQDVIEQAQTILENVVETKPIRMILVQDEYALRWPDRVRTHLREYLALTKKALLLQEIPYARANCPRDAGKALDAIEREMFERDIAVIVPMMTMDSGLMGYVVLPPKTDGTIFTADKIYYLERFANAIAFRIEGEIKEAKSINAKSDA